MSSPFSKPCTTSSGAGVATRSSLDDIITPMPAEFNSLYVRRAVREKRSFEARAIEVARRVARTTERYSYVLRRATTETEILMKTNHEGITSLLKKVLQSPEISPEQRELLKKAFMQTLRNSISRRIATEGQETPKLVNKHQFKEIITGLMYDFLGLLQVAARNGFTFRQSVHIAGKAFLMSPSSLATLLNTYPQISREVITVAIERRDNPLILLDRIMNLFNLLRNDNRFACFDDATLLGVISHYPNSSEEMLQKRLENEKRQRERELEEIEEDPSNNLKYWWDELKDHQMIGTALKRNYLSEVDIYLIIEMIVAGGNIDSPGFEVLLNKVSTAVANLC